jgi:hypothetical protein
LFCADKTYLWLQWPNYGFSVASQLVPAHYFLSLFLGLLIWLSLALFNMQMSLPKATISVRRIWISITALLIISLLMAIFSPKQIASSWAISLPALSLILSFAFINERNKKMNSISFYFALALMLFCQIFLPI